MTAKVPAQGKPKRQIMSVRVSPTKPAGDSYYAPIPSNDVWKAQMRQELEQRITKLREDEEKEKEKLRQFYTAAMLKLPKNVKSMKVSEFDAVYKTNVLETILGVKGQPPISGAATANVPEIPVTYTALQKLVLPSSRAMRKGEVL
jgi:hypothetical protein